MLTHNASASDMIRNVGIDKSALFNNTQIESFQHVVQKEVQMEPDQLAIVMQLFQNVIHILVVQALEWAQDVLGRIGDQLQTQVVSLEPMRVHIDNKIVETYFAQPIWLFDLWHFFFSLFFL